MNVTRLNQKSEQANKTLQSEPAGLEAAVPGIDLAEILRILRRRKKVIAATVLVIMVLAFVIVSSLTPKYTASALVEINPRQANVVDFEAVLSGLPADLETIETELKIIQSRKIAQRVIQRLELNKDPEFNAALRAPGLISSWVSGIRSWLAGSPDSEPGQEAASQQPENEAEAPGLLRRSLAYLSGLVSPRAQTEIPDEQKIDRERNSVIDAFLANLSASPEGRSRVVRINFKSNDPKVAADAANAVADFYIVSQLETKFDAAKRATTWLNERVAELRKEVEEKERAIEQYRSESGLLQGGKNVPLTDEQVSELNAQHVLELARLAEAQARLRQVNNLQNSEGGLDSAVEVLQSGLVQDLRREESGMQRRIADLAEEYGERHPAMISARAELQDLQAKIRLEVNRVVQGLRNEVAVVSARAATLARSLEEAKAQVAKLNQSEVQLRMLEREASASRTLLENLLQRTKQTTSQESFQQADASVVSTAAVPFSPSFPRKKMILPLIFIGALGLGVLLALALEKLDLGFRSAEQVTRYTGFRSLGLLPMVPKLTTMGKAPHHYAVTNPGSAYSEAVRSLYTNVLLSDMVDRPKVLLLASSLPREGKTSLAISMARLSALGGHKTIVVDCDLRRPTVQREMKLEPGPGLSECLVEGVSVDEVIQKDPLSNAHVLRAGALLQRSPEQFDTRLMQMILRHLKRTYDLVILDSAPVLAVSDTLFLAPLADKTIFLARWAETKRAAAIMALERVVEARADVAGVVLSMVDVKSHAQYGFADSGSYHGSLKKYYAD